MQDLTVSPTPRRSAAAGLAERRQANDMVKPFVAGLGPWTARVANLRMRATSIYSTEEERALARLESGALLAEIRHQQSDYRSTIKGAPQHSRLDDVSAAFERLIEQLEQLSGSRLG